MTDRQQAANHQTWEGEMFRLLVENVGDYAVFVVDGGGRVQTWNPGAERLLGYTEAEVVGQSAARFFTPEDVASGVPQEEMRQALQAGRGDDDRWHVKKDGSRFWSSGVMTPLRDEGGTLRGFAKIMRDRTRLKLAEIARDDALAYAESIVDTVREPLLVLDGDLRVRTANRSFYRAFRVAPEETQGRLLYDLGNQQWDIPALRTLLEDILPRDTSFEGFEVRHEFPSVGPKVMVLNARKLYREGDHAELILLAVEDVTALREAERARREAETRFTEMVKNVRDHSIFLTDPEGVITSWNVAAERIMGYSEAEAVGRHYSLIFTPEDIKAGTHEHELRQARERGRAEDERWHVKKDGTRFWALGIVTPLHDQQGRLSGFSKVLRDITDRKRAEEALQEADRRKDEFLAMLAHELRNPLAPLRNAAQVIRLLGTADPNVQRSSEMIERQVQHMTRLVDDLLDVSRITSGKIKLQREPVELAAVVARAVETARPLIEARGHELAVSLPREAVPLDADPTRLAQVVANLLTNAAKYTEQGGHVRLAVEREGAAAVVRVRDDGVGIPREMLPRVFDLFTQVDRSLARSEGGLGIGLTLVKKLAEMHGGTAEAHSEGPGRGSEFVVRLPVLPRPQFPEADQGGRAADAASTPCRVLVVDDNADAAESLAMLLRVGRHEVRTAHDGSTALELAAEFRPDIVLLDIGLPRMDGYEVARRLRGLPGMEGVVLAALTGYGQEEDCRMAGEAGFDAHLVKPADPAALQALLASAGTPGGKKAGR